MLNPATQEVLGHVPLSTPAELQRAVDSAQAAFLEWREVPSNSASACFQLQAPSASTRTSWRNHNGTSQGARGRPWRRVPRPRGRWYCCNMSAHMMGSTAENLAANLDTYSYRQPLGVCAGICRSTGNHDPAVDVSYGACYRQHLRAEALEQDPGCSLMLAKSQEAGLPDGCLNIVHGTHGAVNHLLTRRRARDVVCGSNPAGGAVFARDRQQQARAEQFGRQESARPTESRSVLPH